MSARFSFVYIAFPRSNSFYGLEVTRVTWPGDTMQDDSNGLDTCHLTSSLVDIFDTAFF